jgi:hypothetical protein
VKEGRVGVGFVIDKWKESRRGREQEQERGEEEQEQMKNGEACMRTSLWPGSVDLKRKGRAGCMCCHPLELVGSTGVTSCVRSVPEWSVA